ncbi:hypothetical protein KJ966_08825 [bacterium]|nr:hypothetical protein [bacterium]
MWVNKKYFSTLTETLDCFNREDFVFNNDVFDRFNKEKYKHVIRNIRQLQEKLVGLNNKIDAIFVKTYTKNLTNINDNHTNFTKLNAIDLNHTNLTTDLLTVSADLKNLNLETPLPIREDHTEIRYSLNESIRYIAAKIKHLEGELKNREETIKHLRDLLNEKTNYIKEVATAVQSISNGNLTTQIPWSERETSLFNSLQSVRETFENVVLELSKIRSNQQRKNVLKTNDNNQIARAIQETDELFKNLFSKLEENSEKNRLLTAKLEEMEQFLELVAYYVEGVAKGDYTRKIPFRERVPGLHNALIQLKKTFSQICQSALEAARGNFDQKLTDPENHDLVGAAFQQMFQSFRQRQHQLTSTVEKQTVVIGEMKIQQNELVEYNFNFENKFKELFTSYGESIEIQKEQQQAIDRLQKRNSALENENRTIRQKHTEQNKQLKSLLRQNEKILETNKQTITLCESFFSGLNKCVGKTNSAIDKEMRQTELSNDPEKMEFLADLLENSKKTTEFIKNFRFDFFPEKTVIEYCEFSLIDLIQELQLDFKGIELENGKQIEFDIDDTVPHQLISDESRLKHILTLLLFHTIQTTPSQSIACKVNRVISKSIQESRSSRSMIGFEISCRSDKPINGHQIVLDGFNGLYSIRQGMLDEVSLGLILLRELVETLDGELHLNSVHNQEDTYQLLIPLEIEQSRSDAANPPGAAEKLPDEDYILVMEENSSFFEEIAGRFNQFQLRSLQVTEVEDAMTLAKQRLPHGLCLGMKWSGSQGIQFMDNIRSLASNQKLPVIALTENQKIPPSWDKYCLGAVSKNTDPKDFRKVVEKIEAFKKELTQRLVIINSTNSIHSKFEHYRKFFQLSFDSIEQNEFRRYSLEKDSFVMLQVDSDHIDSALEIIEDCRDQSVDLPIAVGFTGTSYPIQNKIDPLVDYSFALQSSTIYEIYETVQLINATLSKARTERRELMDDYFKSRNTCLNNKQVLMVADNVSATLALRKQLNLQGIEITVNARGKNIQNALSNTPNCNLILIDTDSKKDHTLHVIAEIKSLEEFNRIPIILMNQNSGLGDEEYWLTKGVDRYHAAPVDFETLLSSSRVLIELNRFSF